MPTRPKESPIAAELRSQDHLVTWLVLVLGLEKALQLDGLELQFFKLDGTLKANCSSPLSSSGENLDSESLLLRPQG